MCAVLRLQLGGTGREGEREGKREGERKKERERERERGKKWGTVGKGATGGGDEKG